MEVKSEPQENYIQFCINGTQYKVSNNGEYTPESKLVDFIRNKAGLKGTKTMCREGGCGACIVTVRMHDTITGNYVPKAINSCLAPVLSCNGWEITTVESLGNRKDGFHPIQKRLADFSATQCGFCTPGMAMSMYSLLESKSGVKVKDVESCLDGNICRCTGYRPILDAFKSFAIDAPKDILKRLQDIEDCVDCPKIKAKNVKGQTSQKFECRKIPLSTTPVKLDLPYGKQWVKVTSLETAYSVFLKMKSYGNTFRIVAGNTGAGVFRMNPMKFYLDISNVTELKKYVIDSCIGVTLGSCTTLSSAIQILDNAAKLDGFEYTGQISKHLQRVANVPVRNIGTLGGNLMLKHSNKEFPSDIFMLMEASGAKVEISNPANSDNTKTVHVNMVDFLHMDMEGKFIVAVHLPPRKGSYHFRSFKITKRYSNSHAYLNAGILMRVCPVDNFKVVERPRIVFGGIHSDFVHANATELFLTNKNLNDETVLRGAMEALEIEVNPNIVPGEASPAYRKALTKSLLYKTMLSIVKDHVKSDVKTASLDILRLSSNGKQDFEKDKGLTPLYKAVNKLEGAIQASGEAEYVNDLPILPNELFGAFVLSNVAKAELAGVDTSKAMTIDGVVQFISAKDIPGTNNFMDTGFFPAIAPEQIFVTDKIPSAGAPIGLILAVSQEIASHAASKVIVTYKNKQKPIVNIMQALKKAEKDGVLEKQILSTYKSQKLPTETTGQTHIIKGEHQVGGQYGFHMETQSCVCIPRDDSMDIFSSTQWMDHVQHNVAIALNVPNNYINVSVKRVGGGFGQKITRATHAAAACAIAAYVTNRPVRVILDMETNMNMIGKRSPYICRYEVEVDDNGKIVELKAQMFGDVGCNRNECDSFYGGMFVQNVYAAYGWEVKAGYLITDTPTNTFTRAPGSFNGTSIIEYIMEHIAFVLKKDPLEVRAANYRKDGDLFFVTGQPIKGENLIPKMYQEIKVSANYEERKLAAEKFNNENRWKKRGMASVPTSYIVEYFGANFPFYIGIYHSDGSIAVSHGGTEIGQGINTKVAQTVAHFLEVPFEKIKVKPSNNLTGINSFCTGCSITSELCCDAAMRACNILKKRMQPVKDELGEDATWEKLVETCFDKKIDLSTTYMHSPADKVEEYRTWAVNVVEVEVDILTGEYKVLRVDLLEDVGKSLSPAVDIGQIEGGFLMGQGLWTSEQLTHDETTGQLLTNRSWNYKPPESKDIPEDFRITMLHNAPNPLGVLRSKAVGEPPILASVAVLFALKNAIDSARRDAGNTDWVQINGPVTPEDVWKHSLTFSSQFHF